MKKTVINLAIVSCFALGMSAAQAYNPGAFTDPAAVAAYTKKATMEGQTQNIKIGSDGVRLPYNMAQDRSSIRARENGVRRTYGGISAYYPKPSPANPAVENPYYWNMTGLGVTGGDNKVKSAYSGGYTAR